MEQTGKTVDVLLAIYDPDRRYLEEQLESIKAQDYPALDVIAYDDCPAHPVDKEWVERVLSPVPCRFLPDEPESLGYIGAFEKLVNASDGDYVAFCDQDDVWAPGKITTMVRALEDEGSLLAISDYASIDGDGATIKPSARDRGSSRFSDTWVSGDEVVAHNIFQCLAPGMVMVLRGPFARSITPFSRNTGHDKWAVSCAGIEGTVSYVPEVLAFTTVMVPT